MKKITMFLMLAAAAMLNACEYSMSDIMDELTIAPGSAVIYDGNGADSGEPPVDPYSYVEDSVVTVLDNTRGLVKTDTAHSSYFGFTGWNTQRDGKGTTYTTGQTFQMGKTDVTLYAMWAEGTFYRVTYSAPDATSGTLPTDNTDYASGKEVFALNNGDLARAGWTFQYWTDGFGHNYSAGDSFAITADTTLSAVWTNVPVYTVTYNGINATSGLAPVDSKNYKENEEVVVRNQEPLLRTGYGFSGWDTMADGSGTTYQPGQSFFMPAVNIDLYSVWTIKDWNVRFNPNGGAGTMLDQTFTFGTTKPLTLLADGVVPFTNTEAPIFTGWATSAAGDPVYADGENYRMLTEGADLYATWDFHGSPDKLFSGDGFVNCPIDRLYTSISKAYDVAVQKKDGKIVVVGAYDNNGSDYDIVVARFNTDGTLDEKFGNAGYRITDIDGAEDVAYSVAIDQNDRIVVAGKTHNGKAYDFVIVRYTTDGDLDKNFNSTGIVTTSILPASDIAYSVAIDKNNCIIAVGSTYNAKLGSTIDVAIAKYTPGGILDTDFGTNGKVITNMSGLDEIAYSLALDTYGNIFIAGTVIDKDSKSNFLIAKYTSGGALNTDFNKNDTPGYDIIAFNQGINYGYSVAIQPRDRIVVAGITKSTAGNACFAIARYTSEGALDTTFGKSGKSTTDLGTYVVGIDYRNSLAIQHDNKIIVAGTSTPDKKPVVTLARYTSDGSLDETFTGKTGTGTGLIRGDVNLTEYDYGNSVALYENSRTNTYKIIVAGYSYKYADIAVMSFWQ